MTVSIETLQEVIGAAVDMGGPAGFNITGKVAAPLQPGSNGVTIKVEQPTLDTAQIKNNSGINKPFAESAAMQQGKQRIEDGQIQHAGVLAKSGQDKTINRVLGRGAGYAVLRNQQNAAPPRTMNPRPLQTLRNNTGRDMELAVKHFNLRKKQLEAMPKIKTIAVPEQLKTKPAFAALPKLRPANPSFGNAVNKGRSQSVRQAYARNWAGLEGVFDMPSPTKKA